MMWLIKSGGVPILFIILFGVLALVFAGLFFRSPSERGLGIVRHLSNATLFSIGSGTASSLAAVFHNVSGNPEFAKSPDMHLIVMEGLGESMACAIMGFTLLSLAAFLTALGSRRLPSAA